MRCPYCRSEFPPQDKGLCPSCGKVVLIPIRARRHPTVMKERLSRLAHRRRERLAKLRKTSGIYLSRRMRITTVFVGFFVVGVLLPLHYAGKDATPLRNASKEERAVRNLWVLRTAIECYRHDCQCYPSTEEGLKALVERTPAPGWRGPYVDAVKLDPWRHPYAYALNSNEVCLVSAGDDGIPGTADDIPAPPPDYTVLRLRDAATNAPPAPPEPPGEFPVQSVK